MDYIELYWRGKKDVIYLRQVSATEKPYIGNNHMLIHLCDSGKIIEIFNEDVKSFEDAFKLFTDKVKDGLI